MSEVVVVGAGVVGLAVAHELTRAGHHVTVVSADVPGSRQSCGLTRIFRLAHADGDIDRRGGSLAGLWEEWEARAGRPLLDRVGLILTGDMADREGHLARHGGVQRGRGPRHPLAVSLGAWSFEPTGAAIHAEDTVRFLQEGLELVLAEVMSRGRGRRDPGRRRAARRRASDRVRRPRHLRAAGRRLSPSGCARCASPLPCASRCRTPAPCWINRDEQLCEPFYAVMDGPDHYSIGLSGGEPAGLPEAEHIRRAHPRIVSIAERVFPGSAFPSPSASWRASSRCACARPSRRSPTTAGISSSTTASWASPGPALFKFAPLLGQLAAHRLDPGTRLNVRSAA